MNEVNDKVDCFARISEEYCNALTIKECKKCSFYKTKKDVPNYSIFLKKGIKELLDDKKDKTGE